MFDHYEFYAYLIGGVGTLIGAISTWYHRNVTKKFEKMEASHDDKWKQASDIRQGIDDRINVLERRQAVYESKLSGFDKKLDEVAADIKTLLGMYAKK